MKPQCSALRITSYLSLCEACVLYCYGYITTIMELFRSQSGIGIAHLLVSEQIRFYAMFKRIKASALTYFIPIYLITTLIGKLYITATALPLCLPGVKRFSFWIARTASASEAGLSPRSTVTSVISPCASTTKLM